MLRKWKLTAISVVMIVILISVVGENKRKENSKSKIHFQKS